MPRNSIVSSLHCCSHDPPATSYSILLCLVVAPTTLVFYLKCPTLFTDCAEAQWAVSSLRLTLWSPLLWWLEDSMWWNLELLHDVWWGLQSSALSTLLIPCMFTIWLSTLVWRQRFLILFYSQIIDLRRVLQYTVEDIGLIWFNVFMWWDSTILRFLLEFDTSELNMHCDEKQQSRMPMWRCLDEYTMQHHGSISVRSNTWRHTCIKVSISGLSSLSIASSSWAHFECKVSICTEL